MEGKTFSRQRSQSFSSSSSTVPSAIGQAARNLFVNNVLKRLTANCNRELGKRTAQELLGRGNSAPFLALVGVSLASGSGILTKEDEIECLCKEVRDAARKTKEKNECPDFDLTQWTLKDFNIGPVIAKGCSAVVYAAKCIKSGFETLGNEDHQEHPLAMKMMFNFHAESNALVILKAMQKETIIAQNVSGLDNLGSKPITVSPHPNIAQMYLAFPDVIPTLSESMDLYPHALPPRINPNGYGRNMSLFLIMKRYQTNLRSYLQDHNLHWRSSLMILTQVLEGLVHLSRHQVAHRDIKSDNILITSSNADSVQVVLSDFGCCWANPSYGFKCPYLTEEVDKGGNAALMAPEVANAVPGLFSYIDYAKSDVWAAGALAYEIFGNDNPFYSTKDKKGLDSRNYK